MTDTAKPAAAPENPPSIECCVQCGGPKSRINFAGDEVAQGWPYCINPSCVAFQEPVASASFRRPAKPDARLGELMDDLVAYVTDWILPLHRPPTSSPPSAVVAARAALEAYVGERMLTADEARWLLEPHICNPDTGAAYEYVFDDENATIAKLRLLSSPTGGNQ